MNIDDEDDNRDDTGPIEYWQPDTCFAEIEIHVFSLGSGHPCDCGAMSGCAGTWPNPEGPANGS